MNNKCTLVKNITIFREKTTSKSDIALPYSENTPFLEIIGSKNFSRKRGEWGSGIYF